MRSFDQGHIQSAEVLSGKLFASIVGFALQHRLICCGSLCVRMNRVLYASVSLSCPLQTGRVLLSGCAIFGRDESENAEFSFTQDLVDQLVDNWSLTVNNPSYPTKPSPDKMLTLELCISDKHKPLLLSNSSFLPYLISGLFLDPTHPRGNLDGEIKAWNQQMHSECFAQLALFPDAREMLRGDAAACEALQKVKELGSSAKSREYAEAALLALSDHQLQLRIDEQQHVMLSCESPHNHCCEAMQPRDGAVCGLDADNWSHQSIVQRINDSLINRGYATWYDLSNMKGSTMVSTKLTARRMARMHERFDA